MEQFGDRSAHILRAQYFCASATPTTASTDLSRICGLTCRYCTRQPSPSIWASSDARAVSKCYLRSGGTTRALLHAAAARITSSRTGPRAGSGTYYPRRKTPNKRGRRSVQTPSRAPTAGHPSCRRVMGLFFCHLLSRPKGSPVPRRPRAARPHAVFAQTRYLMGHTTYR